MSCRAAYGVLSDEDKRRIYDRYGEEGLKQQGGGRQDAGDIFQKCVFSVLCACLHLCLLRLRVMTIHHPGHNPDGNLEVVV